MHRAREVFQWRASLSSHVDQDGRIPRGRGAGFDESAVLGYQSLRCVEPFIQIVPRPTGNSLYEIEATSVPNCRIGDWGSGTQPRDLVSRGNNALSCERNAETLTNSTAYEHTRTYCNYLDWQRIPVPWAGLELPRYSRPYRKRRVFDA